MDTLKHTNVVAYDVLDALGRLAGTEYFICGPDGRAIRRDYVSHRPPTRRVVDELGNVYTVRERK